MSSLLTPIFLGITVGALAGGADPPARRPAPGAFLFAWWAPFPLAVGLFALGLFAFLAAVYLTRETADAALQDDFRRRALVSGLALAPLAFVTACAAGPTTTTFATRLLHSWWSVPLQLATAVAALGALTALVRRAYRAARLLAAAQVGLIVIGWGAAQYPYLMIPGFHDPAGRRAPGDPGPPRAHAPRRRGRPVPGALLALPGLQVRYSRPRRRSRLSGPAPRQAMNRKSTE